MPNIGHSNIQKGGVPHFADWRAETFAPEYRVVIPTYKRAEKLCSTTLSLLRKHGIPLHRIRIYVNPENRGGEAPEWAEYLDMFRRHDLLEVHLRPGGTCLLQQMHRILEDAVGQYVIVMSDTVSDITWKAENSKGANTVQSLPIGFLPALFAHGHEMMKAGQFRAWSLSASHDGRFMKSNNITQRLGLLDGNMTGLLVEADMLSIKMHPEDGLIYDVAWACHLWHDGHRFFRYLGMCCKHPYRGKGGQEALFGCIEERRRSEDRCIQRLANRFPELVSWVSRGTYSLKRMQYQFRKHGGDPILMEKYLLSGRGRRPKHANHSMSAKERQRRCRTTVGSGKAPATSGKRKR